VKYVFFVTVIYGLSIMYGNFIGLMQIYSCEPC